MPRQHATSVRSPELPRIADGWRRPFQAIELPRRKRINPIHWIPTNAVMAKGCKAIAGHGWKNLRAARNAVTMRKRPWPERYDLHRCQRAAIRARRTNGNTCPPSKTSVAGKIKPGRAQSFVGILR